ncbi:MAG: DUF5706 domain-containing protein [Mobilicoccus sp.]|nr:DUF5706 domain-containing protein [Mobilicoccus sp.]
MSNADTAPARSGSHVFPGSDPEPDPAAADAAPLATASATVEPTHDDTPAAPKKKRKKKRPSAAEAPAAPLGTSKAVETMFRNAIRAELDIIALAATKANIMISLNGFIISALMISGAFLFNSSPGFLVPAGVFMVTSAVSIAFALLAASPERVSLIDAIRDWAAAVRRREARLRDLRSYVMKGGERPEGAGINLLIYEDRVQISQEDYWERMQDLLRDRDEIYHTMSDQLYWLGEMANRKFKLLNISYSVFRWGLVAAIVAFFAIRSVAWAYPIVSGQTQQTSPAAMGIQEFSDVYEPSAVQQLPDGRLLVVEDEAARAMNILTIGQDGRFIEDSAADLALTRSFGRRLNDLEGLSTDDRGNVYAITSHSTNTSGERSPDREQLLRFTIAGNQAGNIAAHTDLRDALKADAGVAAAVQAATGEAPDFAELNIEGLSFHRESQRLLLGLREPVAGDQTLIVPIENPGPVFDEGAAIEFGTPIALDLSGGGIRALSWDRVLGAYLIVNEIEDVRGVRTSQLWQWSGDPTSPARPFSLPRLIDLENVEAVDSVEINGDHYLLLMSDDGDESKDEPASYLVLPYDQLPEPDPSPAEQEATAAPTQP